MKRVREVGMSLAELLVALGLSTMVLVSALTMLDFGRRVAHKGEDVLEAGELARVTSNYLTTLIRQAEVGVVVSDPTNCLGCHKDVDGALVDNPATDCALDMVSPAPPIRLTLFRVDPSDPNTRVPAEPGNGITIDADRSLPPAELAPETVFNAERRSLYPVVDGEGSFWLLREEEDHDRDGTPEVQGRVSYGVRDLSFRLVRAAPPEWQPGTSVSPSCYMAGACHGTGNTNAGGRDIYGSGVYVAGGPGLVWSYGHPDSYAVRGVRIEVEAASRGRQTGGQAADFARRLLVMAAPRGLVR